MTHARPMVEPRNDELNDFAPVGIRKQGLRPELSERRVN